MCTVSYVPLKEAFVLTSNRDELVSRKTTAPQKYSSASTTLIYPKDHQADGSWIGCNDQGKVACLLNGATKAHARKSSYKRSRGKILLDSFSYPNAASFTSAIDLKGIEPFTLIMIEQKVITELKWDGLNKHLKNKDASRAHLWSSVTLYSQKIAVKKEKWFLSWLSDYDKYPDKNIGQFHLTRHGSIAAEDVNSKFNSSLKTVSITQVKVTDDHTRMDYRDLITKLDSTITLKKSKP